jgi:DNA-binding NarL/FixJ family response regulator
LYAFKMPPIRGALLDVVGLSREAVTLSELAQGALRGLQSAFGCSLGCFTHSPRDGGIEILNCTDAGVLQEYHRDWFAADPINPAVRRYDASFLVPATRLPEWRSMQRHPLYAEWAPSKHVRFLLHIRLSSARYLEAGACNVFLCRPKEEADFGPRELLTLSRVLPELQTAVRRCSRIAAMNASGPLLEILLDHAESRARLALRADGEMVWISKAAQRMLADYLGCGRSLPAILIERARCLARTPANSSALRFVTPRGMPITASFQTARAGSGETFIVIGLSARSGTLPDEFRERYGLTDAEAAVLADLAEGLSNAQIAERRSVSVTTVRTHVGHILSKMGVRSWLQAGVMARASM